MPKEPHWLTRVLVGTVCTIALLSIGWSVSCTASGMWGTEYSKSEDCKDHDNRALQTMFGLLATLVSLRSNPPTDGQ